MDPAPDRRSLVYTLGEAADLLAVGERTILRLGREDRLRVIRLGEHTVRIPRADIDAILSSAEASDARAGLAGSAR